MLSENFEDVFVEDRCYSSIGEVETEEVDGRRREVRDGEVAVADCGIPFQDNVLEEQSVAGLAAWEEKQRKFNGTTFEYAV